MRLAALAFALVCLAAPSSGFAQAITTIEIGQTTTGKPGGTTDLYRFGGVAGTAVTATLTAPGASALVLYTPDGQEMLSAQGTGTVTLEAILTLDDVFLIGVLRENAERPYTLKLTGDEPDLDENNFAKYVGYNIQWADGSKETQCWTDPGQKLRQIYEDGTFIETTIGRDGRFYLEKHEGGRRYAFQLIVKREGGERVETWTYPNGETSVTRSPLEDASAPPKLSFASYLCK